MMMASLSCWGYWKNVSPTATLQSWSMAVTSTILDLYGWSMVRALNSTGEAMPAPATLAAQILRCSGVSLYSGSLTGS